MRSAGRRTRSLNGCSTCRSRHVKCDEGRPNCLTCRSLGVPCGGYGSRIVFVANDSGYSGRFRRPLLNDEERESISNAIALSVSERSVSHVLSEIELGIENHHHHVADAREVNLQRGPFGAFKASLDKRPCELFDDRSSERPPSQSPVSLDEPDLTLDGASLGVELDARNVDAIKNNVPFLDQSADVWPLLQDDGLLPDNEVAGTARGSSFLPVVASTRPPQAPLGTFSINRLPMDEITYLVSKYTDTVIPLLSPVKRTKTMWHVLFLTGGLNTLASLTMATDPGVASLIELFSLLSITAMSLRGPLSSPEWDRWNEVGLRYLMKSEELLQIMLDKAFSPGKVDKYKNILTAILGVAQASTIAGIWTHTEALLLTAERFIRLKGLIKKDKSRRVRFLHHCYGFQRLFYESTYVLQDCTFRRQFRKAINQAGVSTPGEDNIAFRLQPWALDLGSKMQEPKSRDHGENDLHLSIPGQWSLSYYSEIYDVPESFLCLLSQVIRLYNEKVPSYPMFSEPPGISLPEYVRSAKSLEQCILEWDPSIAEIIQKFPENSWQDGTQEIVKNMLEALHQALIIYFYRMVYDIHPATLQSRVKLVLNRLTDIRQYENGVVRCTAAFMWPSFIAASESLEPAVQASFENWFLLNINSSGLQSYSTILEVVRSVWSLRLESKNTHKSWVDVLQQQNRLLLWS